MLFKGMGWTNLWEASLPAGPWVQLEYEYEIILRSPSYHPRCYSLCLDTSKTEHRPDPSFSTEFLPKVFFFTLHLFVKRFQYKLLKYRKGLKVFS